MQTQKTTAKKPRIMKFRPKDLKQAKKKPQLRPALNLLSPKRSFAKKKKKNFGKKKKDRKNISLATGDNIIKSDKMKKCNKKCFNCLKKSYFAKNCLEYLKN